MLAMLAAKGGLAVHEWSTLASLRATALGDLRPSGQWPLRLPWRSEMMRPIPPDLMHATVAAHPSSMACPIPAVRERQLGVNTDQWTMCPAKSYIVARIPI